MKTIIKLALMTSMFIGTGCSHTNNNSKGFSPMVDLKSAKSFCAGRYTIQLPNNAVQFGGGDKYNSFLITSKTGSSVADLNAEYASVKRYFSGKVSTIILDTELKKVGSKSVRIFSGIPGTIEGAPLQLKFWVLDRNTLFKFEIPYMPEKKDLVFDEMNKIIANISARNNDTVPSERGVCILNGFIKDSDSQFRRSTHTIAFSMSDMPSVKTSMQVDAVAHQLPDLITRTESNLKRDGILHLTYTSFKTIRKGTKNQTSGNQLSGLEWISKAPMKGRNGIIATWEHAGTAQKINDPAVLFDFDTGYDGNNVKTSDLSEKEALKIYESILETIKKF
ncbi:T6SS immunity protein Tli4 family protein [Acinetobacter gandensis]|uniref:T6SS immunity protein Tli4 family protein n=1 Tax=Acinetobacter gandensis TaxID=1443941 RepID=UPI003988CD0E